MEHLCLEKFHTNCQMTKRADNTEQEEKRNDMIKWLKLIRIQHWIKNFLVFVPLFFSGQIMKPSLVYITCIAFLTFNCIASEIYIFNDLNDIENDRKHPIKKNRPLASGAVSIDSAKILIVCLGVIIIAMTGVLYYLTANMMVIVLPVVYIFLNVLYSQGLKNVAIIDVLILVSGFFIRTFLGAVVVDVKMSDWLYFLIIFGAFYLGFGKRRNEIMKQGDVSRVVLKDYTKEFLDKNMYVCLGLAIMFYSLWCIDGATVSRIGNSYMIYTVPIVAVIMFMYSLDIEKDSFGDPVDVILSDKIILLLIGVYCLLIFAILYVL